MKDFCIYLFAVLVLTCNRAEAALSKASPAGEEVWRINCGAEISDYTDPAGNLWMRDESYLSLYRWGFNSGTPASTTSPISGTDLDPIFQTNRAGGTNMYYKIEMPNGTYSVKLMFAETYWQQSGKRVFDVAIENNTVIKNLDIYAKKGYRVAYERTFQATVNDQYLDITFPVISKDKALISGIEVKPISVSDDAFLDFVQKKMFWYFWNEADPVTGLVKDKENNWAAGNQTVSSIAVTGYALSVYTVGAKRGWITQQDAYQRIMRVLNTFDTLLENIHGFWYHFVDMSSGARDMGAGPVEWRSEVSTVDSAIFIMGALQAGEYFRSAYPDVAEKADYLYRRMEWTWFTGVGDYWHQKFVNMGWKPENDGLSFTIPDGKPEGGYYCTGWWDTYCETVFVDLLALGSPTYYINNNAWTNMCKWWVDAFGYHFVQQPALFTHQYHHLYFNLIDKHDTAMDYFGNSIKATLANKQTCIDDPLQRYETKIWGLTSCMGPDGGYRFYGGDPAGQYDGTVAPTAAVTSISFTPRESVETARYMYFQYKHHIWGRYGFTDSFRTGNNLNNLVLNNPNFETPGGWWSVPGWWDAQRTSDAAGTTNGADAPYEGSWVFSVANDWGGTNNDAWGYARQELSPALNTGDIVSFSMRIKTDTGYTGQAKLKLEFLNASGAVLNSVYSSTFAGTNPWTSAVAQGYVPAGTTKLNLYCLSEHMGVGSRMAHFDGGSVSVQRDFRSWAVLGLDNGPMIIAIENYRSGMVRDTFMNNQYIKDSLGIAGFKSFSQEPLITESSYESVDLTGKYAFDGNTATRWASWGPDPQWIEADFGSVKEITKITIQWETAYAKSYKIEVSGDEKSWSEIFSTTTGDGGQDIIVLSSPATARYLRVYCTERGTVWGYSIWEMAVENQSKNLAFNKISSASSLEGAGLEAFKAFDGNMATRWASQGSDPQWIKVDLGASEKINKVVLNWETAYGKEYRIQVSSDDIKWTDVYSTATGDGGIDEIAVPNIDARYVRMYGIRRGTVWGYSLWEMAVH